jgi:1,4-dihydroxy-2-naphthoate octaprenyltransferase
MKRENETLVSALWRAAHPFSLLAGVLLYALGSGIAAYLGQVINWPIFWLGQGAVTLLQISSYFLHEYFDRTGQPPFQVPLTRSNDDKKDGQAAGPARVFFLQVALTALTAGAVLTVVLLAEGTLAPVSFLFMGIAFVLSILYAVPPVHLVYSGYGELTQAILVANLFPALAFLLQYGDLHRLLALMTFPLTFLYLAALLVQSLPEYMEDIRNSRQTMLVRLGWQRGMSLHNLLVVLTFIVLALAVIAGLPWRLAFPAFLALPVGIFQIWQMNGIAGGAKPRWRLLVITAMASIGLAAYFMNLALWTN